MNNIIENSFRIRTDLALESKESFKNQDVEIKGVVLEENYIEEKNIKITKVIIKNEEGSKAMRKPVGEYITIEAENLREPDDGYHREVSEELANSLKELLPDVENMSVLVVGLGNRDATPDALGPMVASNLLITRHIFKEYGDDIKEFNNHFRVSAITPGVMAQTGMESAEVLKGIVNEIKPDAIVIVDSLAARNTKRLNNTIQLTDTGINPGSGVGNHRLGLNKELFGVTTIAIGIPTVVDAATIVNDAMDCIIEVLQKDRATNSAGDMIASIDADEKYQLIRELLEPHIGTMYVTPKDVDETVKRLSFTISEALNMAFISD